MAALWQLASAANPLAYGYLPMQYLPPAMYNMHAVAAAAHAAQAAAVASGKYAMVEQPSYAISAPLSPPESQPEQAVEPERAAEPRSPALAGSADQSLPLPLELIDDCRHREERCANALRIPSLEVDFPADPNAHVFASVFGTVCKSCADKSSACRHAKVKFNSTSNSKRRVHVMLFWRRALGPSFPISDILLQDNVWRQLDSCRFGIKRSNGHSKVNGHVCINPAHYEPADHEQILDVLIDYITRLGVYPASRRIVAVVSLRQAFGAEATFRALCDALQKITFTPYTRSSSSSSSSSSDAATPTSGGESTEDARSPVPTPVDTAAALVVRRKKSSSSRKPAPY